MKTRDDTSPIYTRASREAGRRRRRGTLLICAAGVLAAWGWMVVLCLLVG